MIRTTIILGLRNEVPEWLPYEGLAKTLKIAHWLFVLCGWKDEHSPYPGLGIEVEEGKLDDDFYIPCDLTQQWILGCCIHLN